MKTLALFLFGFYGTWLSGCASHAPRGNDTSILNAHISKVTGSVTRTQADVRGLRSNAQQIDADAQRILQLLDK